MVVTSERAKIGEFEIIPNYNQWLVAIRNRGADKVLAEYPHPNYPNFTYAATRGNSNIVGHWNPLTQEGHAYSTPLFFRSFNRKFKAAWLNKMNKAEQKKSNTIRVKGSKGNVYEVAKDGSSCTCPGFTFRNKCKHTAAQKDATTRS